MSLRLAPPAALLCLLLGPPAVQAQPAFLVRDINTSWSAHQLWDRNAELETSGNRVFFVVDDGLHGKELWVNDGVLSVSHLVRDLCPGACSAAPTSLTDVQGILYFIAGDGVHGRELWRSDGTEAGTTLAVDFNLDPEDSVLSLTWIGDSRMFALVDVHGTGQELFVTDGTQAGTQAVAAVHSGSPSPAARVLATSTGLVLYTFDDGSHGVEPWVWNKVTLQSTLLADVNPGSGSSIVPSYSLPAIPKGTDAIAAPWGGFLFTADDGVHGRELWMSDGTSGGTHLVQDIAAGANGSSPFGLTAVNGVVYFTANGPEGRELWRTDGNGAGTWIVKDIYPGGTGSGPQELTAVGGLLFFLATDPTHGVQLFRSDGTTAGTVRLQSLSGPPIQFGGTYPPNQSNHGLSAVAGKLFVVGDENGPARLWISDGTDAGTVLGTSIGTSPLPMANSYAVRGNEIYFRQGGFGQLIWKSDGSTSGTVEVQGLPTQTSSFFLDGGKTYSRDAFAVFGGQVYFPADFGIIDFGAYLWKSDGTAAGTVEIERTPRNPEEFRGLGDRLIFVSSDQLWATDGTPGGAQLLPAPSPVFNLARVGNLLDYTAFDVTTGDIELFKTDGTQDGIADIVSTLAPGIGSNPQLLTTVGDKLFLQVTDAAGAELWVSDGTSESGTGRVADIRPGVLSSTPQNLTAVGGTLFFSAFTDGAGRELWKSDGTLAGTLPVKDIQPGAGSSIADSGLARTFAAPAGGPLFFTADDGANGEELWKSDGTAAGTLLVKNIALGLLSSYPRSLTAVGSRVFFIADDGTHGRELWVSDGTAAGTHLVKDIVPGTGSSVPSNLTADGSVLVFSAFDPDHGVEPWRTDGTAVGTRRITDIAPGPFSASPLGFTPLGANLFFAANDNTHGFEPWAAPQSNVLATFTDVPTTYFAWRFVEALSASGVTSGCGEGQFCPEALVNRAQMAIFLLAARGGASPPPATGTRFQDVPAGYWAGPWIEELAREGIAGGCSVNPPLYCPDSVLTRAEMAILLVGARHETPPVATGTRFIDVPADYWAARWIEQIAADGITGGCGGGRFCPDQPITRGEMAVFLATAFHLPLP